jgi:hypothetical protein
MPVPGLLLPTLGLLMPALGLLLPVLATRAEAGPGSHCRAGEFAYLNARMAIVRRQAGRIEYIKTDNLLSLCADRKSEPLGSLVYRFGPIGSPELSVAASRGQKFNVFERSTTAHSGENILFFPLGSYTYCVAEASGQASGIGLTVFKSGFKTNKKSGAKVVDLFSGNNRGMDFESGLIDLSFHAPHSPILRHYPASNGQQTPCD